MRGNIALLTLAREKDRHGVLDRSAWTAAVGISFRQDQSRQFLIAAYVAGAQYDESVRQIPSPGQPARTEATNFARELATAALEAFTEAERLYGANNEDPANPSRFAEHVAAHAAAAALQRGLRARVRRAAAAFAERPRE